MLEWILLATKPAWECISKLYAVWINKQPVESSADGACHFFVHLMEQWNA